MRWIATLLTFFGLCFSTAYAAPTLTYQGELEGANGAVTASFPIRFSLYDTPQDGDPLWTETHESVSVVDGQFTVVLGEQTPLAQVGQTPVLFLGISIDNGTEMTPRMKVGSALQAQWAAHAQDVAGEDIHPNSVSIGETLVIDQNGQWVGDTTGLRGPEGPAGERGPQGDRGRHLSAYPA